MAASFQQQSRLRKVTYLALIAVLFSTTLVLRRHFVEPKAEELELREANMGEVELTSSALRLTLFGSRGVVVCYLWITADKMKMKHEWNQLELVINSLTKLQPHFIEPWLYQSWDLSYNVSVESDRVNDKYFYISRGIELLSEGVRRNRDNPDLRNSMGTYYQMKIGWSDEHQTLRSLFQMSCVDPRARDPRPLRRLTDGRLEVDLEKFEAFCKEHPHLVRRLRDIPGNPCNTPEKVVVFLEENQKIPSRYQENVAHLSSLARSPLKPPWQRFPVLSPRSNFDRERLEFTYESEDLPDDYETFDAARGWFSYAQDPVDDPRLRRRPRRTAKIIFQASPARAQAYRAERLEQAGWFDEEGWQIKDWFPRDAGRRDGAKKTVVVGAEPPRRWAGEAWGRAFVLYERHGVEHGLLKTPEQLASMTPQELKEYNYGRSVTNFPHHFHKAEVERTPEAVAARKHFYLADQLRRSASREALTLYEHPSAFGPPASWSKPTGWKKIFLDYPEFRHDFDAQMETYEIQEKYLRLVREWRGEPYRWLLVWQNLVGGAGDWSAMGRIWLPVAFLSRDFAVPLRGPFDDVDPQGQPLLSENARERARSRIDMLTGARRTPASSASPGQQ